jgi:uncharacterized membrane protein (UPF0127 family)
MKKYFIIIFLLIFLTACSQKENYKTVEINNKIIKVEIADTPESQYQGLSNRESLCADCGMLFKFKEKEIKTFVMRDMKFPLDIIWIDDNHRSSGAGIIVGISKNLAPEGSDYKNFYRSPAPVDYVLEVNAGFADENNIKVGDKIIYESI